MNILKSSWSATSLNRIALFISGLLLLIYFWVANAFNVNIPYWDDYDLVYLFLEKFYTSDSLWEKLTLLFSFDNEHRIFTHRLILLALYEITGELNLTHVMYVGNTGALALWLFFWKVFEKNALYLLPVTLLLFVPADHIVNWEGTAFIHPYLMLFALLSLYFLLKEDKYALIWALVFAFLATFTLGNGLFIFPAGMIALGLALPIDKEKRVIKSLMTNKKWIIWSLSMLVFAGLYFLNFGEQSSKSSLSALFQNPIATAAFPIVFMGAIFKSVYAANSYLVVLFGGLIWLYLLFLLITKRTFFQKNPLWAGTLLFILITIGVAMLTRSHLGLGTATTKRYYYIRVIFLILLYIATFKIWTDTIKKHIGLLLFLCCFFYLFRMAESIQNLKTHQAKLIGTFQYYEGGDASRLLFPNTDKAVQYLEMAKSKGFYKQPNLLELKPLQTRPFTQIQEEHGVQLALEVLEETDQLLIVKGWAYLEDQHTQALEHYLVLQSEVQRIMVKMDKQNRPDVNEYALTKYYLDECGFYLVLNKKDLEMPSGTYQTGVCLELKGHGIKAVKFFDKQVVF